MANPSPRTLFLNGFSAFCAIAGFLLIFSNFDVTVSLHLLGETYSDLSLGLLFTLVAVLFGGAIIVKMTEQQTHLLKTRFQSVQQKEKAEVAAESATDKVKVLETKVQTLEKALAKALGQTQQVKS